MRGWIARLAALVFDVRSVSLTRLGLESGRSREVKAIKRALAKRFGLTVEIEDKRTPFEKWLTEPRREQDWAGAIDDMRAIAYRSMWYDGSWEARRRRARRLRAEAKRHVGR